MASGGLWGDLDAACGPDSCWDSTCSLRWSSLDYLQYEPTTLDFNPNPSQTTLEPSLNPQTSGKCPHHAYEHPSFFLNAQEMHTYCECAALWARQRGNRI